MDTARAEATLTGMPKILHCRDAGFDCNAVVQGDSAEDVLRQVRPHAAAEHGVQVTPELEKQLTPLIRDA